MGVKIDPLLRAFSLCALLYLLPRPLCTPSGSTPWMLLNVRFGSAQFLGLGFLSFITIVIVCHF